MAYELPELPYGYDALEPYVDEETMRLHHEKHHGSRRQPQRRYGEAPRSRPWHRGRPDRRARLRPRGYPHRRPQQRWRARQPLDVLAIAGPELRRGRRRG